MVPQYLIIYLMFCFLFNSALCCKTFSSKVVRFLSSVASQLYWWRKSKYPEKVTVFSKSLTNFISLYNVVSNTLAKCRNHITFDTMGTDCIGKCKSNYHMMTVLESDLCCICHSNLWNKADWHDITEILVKIALKTHNPLIQSINISKCLSVNN
jgi:hypothetical protein